MEAVLDLIPPPTPAQQRAGILKSLDDLHREGMTGVKDPAHLPADMGCVCRPAERGETAGARLRAMERGGHAGLGARGARRDTGLAPAAEVAGRRRAVVLRREDLHGRQRRGAHRLDVSSDWNKNSTDVDAGNTRLSVHRPGRVPSDAAAVPPGRDPRRNPRHRRPRHRLGGGQLRAGAGRNPHPRAPAQHHPRQHSHRPRTRGHGDAAVEVRRGLSRGAGALHLVDRRHLRGKFRAGAIAAPGTPAHPSSTAAFAGEAARIIPSRRSPRATACGPRSSARR